MVGKDWGEERQGIGHRMDGRPNRVHRTGEPRSRPGPGCGPGFEPGSGQRIRAILLMLALIAAGSLACASVPTAGTGDLAFRLLWQGESDLDLYVADPSGERLFFAVRESASGGVLDVDCNNGAEQLCDRPIENVFWPAGQAPAGEYRVWVESHSVVPAETPLEARILVLEGERVVAELEADLQANGDRLGPYAVTYAPGEGVGTPRPADASFLSDRPLSHQDLPEASGDGDPR